MAMGKRKKHAQQPLFVAAATLGWSATNAQTLATSPTLTGQTTLGGTLSPFSYQLSTDAAFIGRGSVDLGSKTAGVFKEITSSASFVMSDQLSNAFILRLGKEDGEFEPWHVESAELEEDFKAFLACLELTGRHEATKQRMAAAKKARTARKRLAKKVDEW